MVKESKIIFFCKTNSTSSRLFSIYSFKILFSPFLTFIVPSCNVDAADVAIAIVVVVAIAVAAVVVVAAFADKDLKSRVFLNIWSHKKIPNKRLVLDEMLK